MFLKVENKSQWRSLSDKALFKTFFHSSDWEDFLEKEFFWLTFEHYIWRDELLLSIARCRLLGKEKIVSHPFCEYGGPLPLKEGIDFESFAYDFQKEFGLKARIKLHPYISRSLDKQHSTQGISTFWIENYSKKSADDLWKGLRKTLRQEIKGGEGQGIYVEKCRSKKDLAQFYDIYLGTVRRHKNIPLPFAVFKFLYGDDADAGILLAKKEGKVLGGSVFLFYKPFIHYFLSANDCKFRKYNIGHLILWSAIQGHKGSEGYDYFDLGGTRKGSALEIFKRGWGAEEYPIYEAGPTKVGSGNLFLRGVVWAIPVVAMKRLAPFALWAKI